MTVELIRHGETALQREHRYQGRLDAPLSPEGRAGLKPAPQCPDRVYVSQLLRARQTAALLFPQAEQVVVPGLEEMDFGRFEGKNYRELSDDPAYQSWVDGFCLGPCPGGESKQEFCARVCAAFEALLQDAWTGGEDSVTIVAHGGTQMAVMERFAIPQKDYFDWHLESGQGYRAQANWGENGLTLTLLAVTDYRRETGPREL